MPAERVGQLATRSSSARPTTSARTPSSSTSLTVTTSPVPSGWRASDHVEALVEHDLRAALEVVELDLGVEADPHLAAARQHVDRAVVVLADHHAVGRGRLGELVDLVAQRGDVLARLTKRVVSFSFCETAWASWPLVSSSRSSSVRTRLGASGQLAREGTATLLFERSGLRSAQLVKLRRRTIARAQSRTTSLPRWSDATREMSAANRACSTRALAVLCVRSRVNCSWRIGRMHRGRPHQA